MHEGHKHGSHEKRHAENQRDRPGECLQEVVYHACRSQQEGEKRDADGQRSRQDGLEEVCGTQDRGVPTGHAFAKFLQIVVDDDDAIVHNHAQSHDERGQRHGVQFNVEAIEQSQGNKYGDGNGGCCYQCHTQRQQKHHDYDHRSNGDKQLFQEIIHAVAHDPALVGNAENANLGRQFLLLELIQHFIYLVAHGHDVLALLHFYGEQQAFLAVVGDITVRLGIFPDYAGHVFQANHIALRVGVNDLLLHIV